MLSVREIMRTDVVTVAVDDTVRSLARVLTDSEISGAPVLDGNGRIVGVASSTDLVRLAAEEYDVAHTADVVHADVDHVSVPDADAPEEGPDGLFLPEDSPFHVDDLLDQFPGASFDTIEVGDIMTPVAFSVEPDMPVPELCGLLVRGRTPRALVVSEGHLLGIVTSQDVLRGIAEQHVHV